MCLAVVCTLRVGLFWLECIEALYAVLHHFVLYCYSTDTTSCLILQLCTSELAFFVDVFCLVLKVANSESVFCTAVLNNELQCSLAARCYIYCLRGQGI